jgi:hypothetical protein
LQDRAHDTQRDDHRIHRLCEVGKRFSRDLIASEGSTSRLMTCSAGADAVCQRLDVVAALPDQAEPRPVR